MFPVGLTWDQERRRIEALMDNLRDEFGQRCRVVPHRPSEDSGYDYTPHSGTIVVRPRGRGVPLVILICTFGIATTWPCRYGRHLGLFPFHSSEWVPWWWDDADSAVEESLARASGCLADAGYTYVADPILDESYDGAVHAAGENWFARYFGAWRSAYRRVTPGADERASRHTP